MEQMRFSVVPELLRAYDALHLRIKMREEAGAAEQEPVKKEDVVELHSIEHRKKAGEKLPEAEAIAQPVPRGKKQRAGKQQNCREPKQPAERMRAAKALCLRSGTTARTSFGAEEKKRLF